MHLVEIGLLVYFTLSLAWSYALMTGAWRMLRKPDIFSPEGSLPLVSVLIPAYNEEFVILDSVRSILRNAYMNIEVCVCDDGSADSTSQVLIDTFDMKPVDSDELVYVSQRRSAFPVKLYKSPVNRGRAGALNKALSIATGKYCIATDADTILDHHGIGKMVAAIMTNPKLGAVGGTLMLANELALSTKTGLTRGFTPQISKRWVAGTQAVEYLRAFLYGRLGLNKLGGNVIVSGAFGLFDTSLVRQLDGWNEQSVAEDFDITVRIRQAGRDVRFIPYPVAYTQAPPDVRSLGNQRSRWHRGLTEIFFRGPGRSAMFRHGVLGRWVLPVHFFVEWLAPIMELIGLTLVVFYLMQGQHTIFLAPLMLAGYLLNVLLSLVSIKFEKDNFNRYDGSYGRGIVYALLEPFWYRPLMIYWRLRGLFEYIIGKKGWGGKIMRTKFGVLATLLLLVSPVQAASRVELVVNTEVGEVVTRTDTSLLLTDEAIDAGITLRDREDEYEMQYALGYIVGRNSRFSIRTHATVADRGLIFPRWSAGSTATVNLGRFVPSVDYTHQFFSGLELGFISPQLDYYAGNWRLAIRYMVATDTAINAVTGYVQYHGDEVQWSLFASHGDEVLDIPVIIGENRVVGGTIRVPISQTVSTVIGSSYGSRNDNSYATVMGGIRFDF